MKRYKSFEEFLYTISETQRFMLGPEGLQAVYQEELYDEYVQSLKKENQQLKLEISKLNLGLKRQAKREFNLLKRFFEFIRNRRNDDY